VAAERVQFFHRQEGVLQRLAAGENDWLGDQFDAAFRVGKVGANVLD